MTNEIPPIIDGIMTKEQKEIYMQIDNILWEFWDPIGINDDAPRDEYQSYTPQIFKLKIQGADIHEIANKLYEFETVDMGLIGNIEHCRNTADKISALGIKNDGRHIQYSISKIEVQFLEKKNTL